MFSPLFHTRSLHSRGFLLGFPILSAETLNTAISAQIDGQISGNNLKLKTSAVYVV